MKPVNLIPEKISYLERRRKHGKRNSAANKMERRRFAIRSG